MTSQVIDSPKLRFLIDESVGIKTCNFIKNEGYEAVYVGEIMAGASDSAILDFAERNDFILVTNDKDFGELVFRLGKPSSGVILLRLRKDLLQQKEKYLKYVFKKYRKILPSHFIVITSKHIRIRPLM